MMRMFLFHRVNGVAVAACPALSGWRAARRRQRRHTWQNENFQIQMNDPKERATGTSSCVERGRGNDGISGLLIHMQLFKGA
jgi:hypothetical protein